MTALLFDFDGTIADTSHAWTQTTRARFAEHGIDLAEETFHRLLAYPWHEVLSHIHREELLVIEREIVATIKDAYLACRPAVGLDRLLRQFSHVPKAIVTSSYRERLITPYLHEHGLARHFPIVVGCEDTEELKPSPEPVLLALRLLGQDSDTGPSDTGPSGTAWLIGDTEADMSAARSAGIGAIRFGRRDLAADHGADSMHALTALLVTLLGQDVDSPQR